MKSVHILPLTATALIAAAIIVISASAFAAGVSGSASGTGTATGTGTVTGSGSISGTAGVRSNGTTQTTARSTASTNASRNSVVGGQALGTSVLDGNTKAVGRGALDNTVTGAVNGQADGSQGSTRAAVGPEGGTTDSTVGIGTGGSTLPADTALTVRGPRTADENAMLANLNFGNSDSNHDQRLNPAEFTAAGLPATLFSSVDANHDGFVSDAELRASGNTR